MANMSYCRFRNTKNDLNDCLFALERQESLSREEAEAMHIMMSSFLRLCEDEMIIDGDWEEKLDEFYEEYLERMDDE